MIMFVLPIVVQANSDDAQQNLTNKVKEASDIGVSVHESFTDEKIHVADLNKRKLELSLDYERQLSDLNKCIAAQKINNEQYINDQKQTTNTLIQDQWSEDEFNTLIRNEYDDLTIINRQLDNTYLDTGTLKVRPDGVPTHMSIGDTFTYKYVLNNPKTGRPVDFKFTVKNIVDSSTNKQVQTMAMTLFNTKEMEWQYGDFHLTLQIEFLDSASEESVFLNPILNIIDIDGEQAVKVDGVGKSQILPGKKLTVSEDGIVTSPFGDADPANKNYWALFNLVSENKQYVDGFTYTFYDGTRDPFGVFQGIGTSTINFLSPEKKIESVNIHYTNLLPYSNVTTRYIDELGNQLKMDSVQSGNTGNPYETNPLKFDGYTFKEVHGTPVGSFTDQDQTVTYIYTKDPVAGGKVTAKYLDTTGTQIHDPVVKSENIGDSYTTDQLTIPGYTFKEVQGNPSGTFTDQEQTVTYIYTKDPVAGGKVTAKYLDTTGTQIHDPVVKSGNIGQPYGTKPLIIDGYYLIDIKGDPIGFFTDQEQTVTYIYKKIELPTIPTLTPGKGTSTPAQTNSSIPSAGNNTLPQSNTPTTDTGTPKQYPATGEKQNHSWLIAGILLILAILGYYFWDRNKKKTD